jgi:hypothetical protein
LSNLLITRNTVLGIEVVGVSEQAVNAPPVPSGPAVTTAGSGVSAVRAMRWGQLAAPGLIFVGIRLFGLTVLLWQSWANGYQLADRLTRWDGQWFLGIAGGGYANVPLGLVDAYGRRSAVTPLAFFPGYPYTVEAMRFVTGAGLITTGLLVSLLAGVVLAHGLARLGELVPGGSRRAGLLLVALVAAAPMGVVWSMAYSEALFCACAVWALVAVLRREWVLAGWCSALAGLVRPTGFAVLAAVGLATLVAVLRRQDGWRPWAGGILAPLGLAGYLGFVAARTGSPTGWFTLQRHGWDSKFDAGAATLRFSAAVLRTRRSVLEVVTIAILIGAIALLVKCLRQNTPWPLMVYAAGVLVMDLGSNGLMNSKARLLLPAFTLLLPVALTLARRRPSTVAWVLTTVTLTSAWFGGYALTGWHYAI